MISQDQAEAAIEWIDENAIAYGVACGGVKGADHYRRITKGELIQGFEGTAQQREADALAHPVYKKAVGDLVIAETSRATLATQIKAKELLFELWRSQNSMLKKGFI